MLSLIYAPHPIFKQKAVAISSIDESVRQLTEDMFNLLESEHGIGMAATMVGVLKRVVVINVTHESTHTKLALINPTVIKASSTMQTIEEASLSFPGISAEITRPDAVTVRYTDFDGLFQEIEATGLLSTLLQHEIDYLDGRVN